MHNQNIYAIKTFNNLFRLLAIKLSRYIYRNWWEVVKLDYTPELPTIFALFGGGLTLKSPLKSN